jgi:hypothetical protein
MTASRGRGCVIDGALEPGSIRFLVAAQADPTSCTLDSSVLPIDLSDGSVYTVDWTGTHPTGPAKSVYEGGKVKFGNATGPRVVPANPYPNIDFTINWG